MNLTHEQMLTAFPKSSDLFDGAVDRALNRIHVEAALVRETKGHASYKRIIGWALAGALLLAGALGIAEGVRLGVFDFLLVREDLLPQANELTQTDLASMTVGHTTLRVTEAIYDGATIRLVMSVQNDTIHRPLTEEEVYGSGEFGDALAVDGVIAQHSFDWFTIDGKEHSITGGSGGQNAVGTSPGEAVIYFELLLTESEGEQIDAPTKNFTLGLPVKIADTQQDMQMLIPIRYVAANLLRNVTPAAPITFGDENHTVTVTDARLSPIRNVVELRVDVPAAVSDDAAWEYIQPWYCISLLNKHGQELGKTSTSYYGLPTGETDDARHFCIRSEVTPQESYPDGLYIAPMGFYGEKGEWAADMNLAIQLKMED
ncbi:MAG: hypothetical protein RSB91_01930 [Clostridia bacterium]